MKGDFGGYNNALSELSGLLSEQGLNIQEQERLANNDVQLSNSVERNLDVGFSQQTADMFGALTSQAGLNLDTAFAQGFIQSRLDGQTVAREIEQRELVRRNQKIQDQALIIQGGQQKIDNQYKALGAEESLIGFEFEQRSADQAQARIENEARASALNERKFRAQQQDLANQREMSMGASEGFQRLITAVDGLEGDAKIQAQADLVKTVAEEYKANPKSYYLKGQLQAMYRISQQISQYQDSDAMTQARRTGDHYNITPDDTASDSTVTPDGTIIDFNNEIKKIEDALNFSARDWTITSNPVVNKVFEPVIGNNPSPSYWIEK